jgi:long-chain fatty acid transport protein
MGNKIKNTMFSLVLTVSATAQAAGFGLIEQSVSMGNGFAGGAAAAEDASTIYFNPAGMTYLPDNQLVMGLHAARPSANFKNDGSTRAAGAGGGPTSGGNGGDGGSWAFIPNFYYVKGISPNVKVGIAVSPLFGLKTEYDKDWVGRYHAIKSDLRTININPSIAFKANEKVSLGFGITAMRAEAELTNAVDFGTLLGGPIQGRDGLATIKGDDWAWGWNIGAIFQLDSATRLGMAYRSAIHEELEGTVRFSNVPAPLAGLSNFQNGDVTAKFVTPESVSASFVHNVNSQWDIMGDVIWTRWSRFKDLTVVRNTGGIVTSVPENWHNATRVGFGTSYKYNGDLKLRVGVAYDESPIPDSTFRTPRVPDSDRIWLSLGLNYKVSPTSSIDVAYTHISFKGSKQNKVNDAGVVALQDTLKGDYDNYANILSAQYTHSF